MNDALLAALRRRHPNQAEILPALLPVLETGDPLPFLLRYRAADLHGTPLPLIRKICGTIREERELVRRREAARRAIEGVEAVPEGLVERIDTADRSFVEDVIRRFKGASGSAAEDPMAATARRVLAGEAGEDLGEILAPFCGADGAPPTAADQTHRLVRLMAETMGADPAMRARVREAARRCGIVIAPPCPGKSLKDAFAPLRGLEVPVGKLKPRVALLLRRAQKLGLVKPDVVLPEEVREKLLLEVFDVRPERSHGDLVRAAAQEALGRIALPAAALDVLRDRRRAAERVVLPAIAQSLRDRLMTAPVGATPLVAVAPGAGGSCRIVAVGADGNAADTAAVHPLPPRSETDHAVAELIRIISQCGARVVVVAGSRRARALRDWVVSTLQATPECGAMPVPVNETGASLLARAAREGEEVLPESVRVALSIGRLVQFPVRELVRYDLTRIPLDPNQRDVDQGELKRTIAEVIEECVAEVGVDVNTADAALLAWVPGLDEATARAIVAHRTALGGFATREQLREVDGLTGEAWQRASGFLRVVDGPDPLDRTGVHPTGAAVAAAVAARLEMPLGDVIGRPDLLGALDPSEFAGEVHTVADVASVLAELGRRPGDPRGPFVPPVFNPGIRSLRDLEAGMELNGVVTRIADFGVFVDLGVRTDGLVHVSELAHGFVRNPADHVKPGDPLKVKVLGIDGAKRRISLSVRQLLPPPEPQERPQWNGPDRVPEGAAVGAAGAEAGRAPRGRGRDDRPSGAPGRGPRREGGRGRRPDRGDRGGDRRDRDDRRDRGRGRGDSRDRGGADRGQPMRDIPRENSPFFKQLSAISEQLGLAKPAPSRPKPRPAEEGEKQQRRSRGERRDATEAAAVGTDIPATAVQAPADELAAAPVEVPPEHPSPVADAPLPAVAEAMPASEPEAVEAAPATDPPAEEPTGP